METAPNGRIQLQRQDNVIVLTLNDPSVLNAFGFKLRQDISWALDRVETSGARCLMITGAGRAFCSGANLNDPDRPPRDRAAEARGEVKSDLESWYNPTFIRLRDLTMPIVTAKGVRSIPIGASTIPTRIKAQLTIPVSRRMTVQAKLRTSRLVQNGNSAQFIRNARTKGPLRYIA